MHERFDGRYMKDSNLKLELKNKTISNVSWREIDGILVMQQGQQISKFLISKN